MAVNEQIVTGRKFRKLIDEATKLWQRISFWTKSSDVEFDDGKDAETKIGAIDGITDSLVSTSSRIAASAKAVNTLSNKLTQQPDFVIDPTTGKITGYTTQEGGAGAVFPFSSVDNLVSVFSDGARYESGINLNTPNLSNYQKIIVAIAGNWTTYVYGSDVKIVDIDTFKKTPITISSPTFNSSEGTVSITYISNTRIKIVSGVRVAPCILLV